MPITQLLEKKLASLASLAEELGNPLTAINARLHSLKKSLGAESPQREDLAAIDKEIRRLEAVLKEFLQDFRVLLASEAGKAETGNKP